MTPQKRKALAAAAAKALANLPTHIDADPNKKFRVMRFTVESEEYGSREYGIYILNAGDCFQGFGGSSSGLVVRKTASLIVRDNSAAGCVDTEYNVNDQRVWNQIFSVAQKAKLNLTMGV